MCALKAGKPNFQSTDEQLLSLQIDEPPTKQKCEQRFPEQVLNTLIRRDRLPISLSVRKNFDRC